MTDTAPAPTGNGRGLSGPARIELVDSKGRFLDAECVRLERGWLVAKVDVGWQAWPAERVVKVRWSES